MAITKITGLRTWTNNETLSARDYVYERNTTVRKINEVIDEQNQLVTDVRVTQEGRIDALEDQKDTLQSDVTDLENNKVNKSGDTMSGQLDFSGTDQLPDEAIQMGNNNISTSGKINDYTFQSGQEEKDPIKYANLSQLFDLGSVTPGAGETPLQAFTAALTEKFASIKSTEDLTELFLRRDAAGTGAMERNLDMGNNNITNVGTVNSVDISALQGEVATLKAYFEADDPENSVIDKFQEVLAIFDQYDESFDLKTKLDQIEQDVVSAENVQSDWDEDDTNSDAFIQNKPSIYEQGTINTLLAGKVDVGTLNSNIMLYPTSTYEVGGDFDGYAQMVTEFSDARYDDTEVIVYTTDDRTETGTSSITSTNPDNPSLIGLLIADAGLLVGDVSNINTTTIGQVRHVSGNVDTFLRYKIFNSSDMTTPIATSEWVSDQQSDVFFEIFESGVINNASFDIDDRIVIHYEAYHEGAQDPIVAIKFGGENPTRTLLPVPLSVVQNAQLIKYDNTTSQLTATDVQAAIDELNTNDGTIQQNLTDHISDTTAAHAASAVSFDPAGVPLTQTDVQAAIAELFDGNKINSDYINFQFDDVLQGYYDSEGTSLFYEEDTFTNEIPAAVGKLYINLTDNTLYRYDGSSYVIVIEAADIQNLGSIPDVVVSGAQDGEFLKFDGSNWVNASIPTINTLGDIGNVDVTGAVTGKIIKYNAALNGGNGGWAIADDDAGTTISTLDDVGDVTADTVSANQFLRRNANNDAWINHTLIKDDVGLSNLENYPIATNAEVENNTTGRYMDVAATKHSVNKNYSAGVIETNANTNTKFWTGTQAEYDAITNYDNDTLYIITG